MKIGVKGAAYLPLVYGVYLSQQSNIKSCVPFQNLCAHVRWSSGCPYLRDESVSDVHLQKEGNFCKLSSQSFHFI